MAEVETIKVNLTSSTHAWVIVAYIFTIVNGMAFQSGLASSRGLTMLLSDWGYTVWASAMILSGVGCLIASIAMPKVLEPSGMLWAEFVSVLVLATCFGLYEWGLLLIGLETAPTTQFLAVCFAVGGVARAIQIQVDLYRLRRAVRKLRM